MNYPYWKILFILRIGAPDKQLGAVISQNDKPIDFFSGKLIKSQQNYTKKNE